MIPTDLMQTDLLSRAIWCLTDLIRERFEPWAIWTLSDLVVDDSIIPSDLMSTDLLTRPIYCHGRFEVAGDLIILTDLIFWAI